MPVTELVEVESEESGLTVGAIDKALMDLASRRIVAESDLPDFVDTTGMRVITEKVHEGSLLGSGTIIRYLEVREVADSLLDMRSELTRP